MFFVSLQADHLIITKTTDKVFRLNYFVFVPISLVLLFKKLLQLVSLFLLIRPIQLKFSLTCDSFVLPE